ncbi:MAG: dihydroorotate dehydrogenase [Anaerolineae bacterium]|nr:dihydroorotate dehydrogenase [Anaerolineae bacterium]
MISPEQVDLSTEICGVRLANPTILASGVLGLSGDVLARVARSGAGAVVTKSCSLKPRVGHPNPVVVDYGAGVLNAVGLANPGVEAMVAEIRRAREMLAPAGVPIIASIFANSIYDFGTTARYISEAEPDLIEANISCPNVEEEFGQIFSSTPYVAGQVTRRVKSSTRIPVIVKLSPNVPSIADVARAVVAAGADAISAINTVGPGMLVDVETATPVLSNRVGGMSGPAIRPLAIRCVYDICAAVSVPVIGIGGVSDGRDAAEMISVGACAVGVGTAVYRRGIEVFGLITEELRQLMARIGLGSLADLRGRALPEGAPGKGGRRAR